MYHEYFATGLPTAKLSKHSIKLEPVAISAAEYKIIAIKYGIKIFVIFLETNPFK